MTPEEVAAVRARTATGLLNNAVPDREALLAEVDRLAGLVAKQAAALARVEALIDTWRPGFIQDATAVRAALAGEQP